MIFVSIGRFLNTARYTWNIRSCMISTKAEDAGIVMIDLELAMEALDVRHLPKPRLVWKSYIDETLMVLNSMHGKTYI